MTFHSHLFAGAGCVVLLVTAACSSDPAAAAGGAGAAGRAASSGTGGSALVGGSSNGGPAAGGASSSGGFANTSFGGLGAAPASGGAAASGGALSAGGSGGAAPNGGAGPSGGAAPSAGTGPTGSGGAPGPGGDSLCPGLTDATSCDGFENAAPGMAGSDWTIDGGITVDSTKFFRGKKSVKYSSATRAYIVNKKLFSGTSKATNNELWGRYWVLAGVSTYPAGHTVFGTLADAADSSDPNRFHFVGGSRQRLMAEIRITGDVYTNAGGGQNPTTAAPPFPVAADGWQCWEFHVTADDSYSFYINGTEVTDMRITAGKANMGKATLSPLPVFGQIQLGWQSFSGGAVVSGWIDEVAFGPNRITCAM